MNNWIPKSSEIERDLVPYTPHKEGGRLTDICGKEGVGGPLQTKYHSADYWDGYNDAIDAMIERLQNRMKEIENKGGKLNAKSGNRKKKADKEVDSCSGEVRQ